MLTRSRNVASPRECLFTCPKIPKTFKHFWCWHVRATLPTHGNVCLPVPGFQKLFNIFEVDTFEQCCQPTEMFVYLSQDSKNWWNFVDRIHLHRAQDLSDGLEERIERMICKFWIVIFWKLLVIVRLFCNFGGEIFEVATKQTKTSNCLDFKPHRFNKKWDNNWH